MAKLTAQCIFIKALAIATFSSIIDITSWPGIFSPHAAVLAFTPQMATKINPQYQYAVPHKFNSKRQQKILSDVVLLSSSTTESESDSQPSSMISPSSSSSSSSSPSSGTTKENEAKMPSPPPSFLTSSLAHHHTAIKTRNITTAIAFYSLFDFKVEVKFRAGPARAAWLIHDPPPPPSSSSSLDKSNDDNQGSSPSSILPPPQAQKTRLEIIEVPSYSLNEKPGQIKRSMDLIKYETALGLNHFALDVTHCIESVRAGKNLKEQQQQQQDNYDADHVEENDPKEEDEDEMKNDNTADNACNLYNLKEYVHDLNKRSYLKFQKTLRMAVEPTKQIIGPYVYELCFIYDVDGSLIELIHFDGITSAAEKSLERSNAAVAAADDDETNKNGAEDWMRWGWEPWDGKGFVGSNNSNDDNKN